METYHVYRSWSEKHEKIVRVVASSDDQAKDKFEEIEKLEKNQV